MAHIHELIDWTAGVYIVHNNKVLIRLHDKIKKWISQGAQVSPTLHNLLVKNNVLEGTITSKVVSKKNLESKIKAKAEADAKEAAVKAAAEAKAKAAEEAEALKAAEAAAAEAAAASAAPEVVEEVQAEEVAS